MHGSPCHWIGEFSIFPPEENPWTSDAVAVKQQATGYANRLLSSEGYVAVVTLGSHVYGKLRGWEQVLMFQPETIDMHTLAWR